MEVGLAHQGANGLGPPQAARAMSDVHEPVFTK
jgi:hypothetical protein